MIESLPADLIHTIFILLPITDKRKFIRTCITYATYSTRTVKVEKEFQKMICQTKFLCEHNYTGFYNPLHKYTIELLYDNYSIPDKYIILENRILFQYECVYYKLGLRGDLDLLKKLLVLNKTYNNSDHALRGAAFAGKLHVLIWMNSNGYVFNTLTSTYACKGNQFDILKWLVNHNCPINDTCVTYSAKVGNLEMLKWLIHEKKCRFNNDCTFAAAYNPLPWKWVLALPGIKDICILLHICVNYILIYPMEFIQELKKEAI